MEMQIGQSVDIVKITSREIFKAQIDEYDFTPLTVSNH